MDKLGTSKQLASTMPNFIHSLDASSLALLWKYFSDVHDNGSANMFTVHDCFAVTADKVALLVKTMTAVYIKI